MSRIETRVNSRSPEFQANVAHMQGLVNDLLAKVAEIRLGGGEAYQKRHRERGEGQLALREADHDRCAKHALRE